MNLQLQQKIKLFSRLVVQLYRVLATYLVVLNSFMWNHNFFIQRRYLNIAFRKTRTKEDYFSPLQTTNFFLVRNMHCNSHYVLRSYTHKSALTKLIVEGSTFVLKILSFHAVQRFQSLLKSLLSQHYLLKQLFWRRSREMEKANCISQGGFIK